MPNYELTHHGIKGMKWGVRRTDRKRSNERVPNRNRHDKTKVSRKPTTSNEPTVSQVLKQPKQSKKISRAKKWFTDNFALIGAQSASTFNDYALNESIRNSINASNMAASLSMSGGMNPFMFGMM